MAKLAIAGIKQVLTIGRDAGEAVSLTIAKWEPKRSDPQRKTLWMWHGEVAAELSIRGGMRWSKNDVHEIVFIEKFMPHKELIDPQTGEIKSRPLRTSEAKKSEISEAMGKYVAWAYENGIEITIPEDPW
jgi:hypothetical protein